MHGGTNFAPFVRVPSVVPALVSRLALFVVLLALFAPPAGTAEVVAPEAEPLRAWRAGLRAPTRMALGEDGTVYVADPPAGQVIARGADGRLLWRRTGLGRPLGIALDGRGNLLIANANDGAVRAYSLETWDVAYVLGVGVGETGQAADISVAADNGRIYVVDSAADQVRMYDAGGVYAGSFGVSGEEEGQLNFPVAVEVDESAGDVFVVDQRNRRVQVFDLGGAFRYAFGEYGDEDFQLQAPQGLHIDADGRVWLADAMRGRVFVFDRLGTPVEEIGEFGVGAGELRQPADLLVDAEGRLLVASANNGRIEMYSTDGSTDPEAYAPAEAVLDEPLVGAGRTLRVHIEVAGHRVDGIDISTVSANGVYATTASVGDEDADGEAELIVTFDGADLGDAMGEGLVFTGDLGALVFESERVDVSLDPVEDTAVPPDDDTAPAQDSAGGEADDSGEGGAGDAKGCGCGNTHGPALGPLLLGLALVRRRRA